jgi:DNA-directed RNA polymerase subunit RPC12/RpoP
MLSALDVEIVGTEDEAEARCRECSEKHFGPLRAQRIMAWLEHDETGFGPRALARWQANEDAMERGYECDCGKFPAEDASCPSCGVSPCVDCGKRLDSLDTPPVAS